MKVLIVFAHPEKRSFNGSLLDETVKYLTEKGDQVKVSDLYRMNWKTTLDENDFPSFEKGTRLYPVLQSAKSSYSEEKFTKDVMEEQEKMKWADLIILQFPFWWFSVPAILKGWVDRVFTYNFAYGLGEYDETHFGERYGEGAMVGKKGMLMVTAGGHPEIFSKRGIDGPIDDLLFPINHGLFFYMGMDVLPSFVNYQIESADEKRFQEVLGNLKKILDNIDTIKPINYRKQNFGDYVIPAATLKEGLELPGETGYDMHILKD
ncbi:hypothetical protein NCAS_0J01620 [Naumovozyma castellii]|uniref:Flavodoxin-like fold domain-containing protein n=1 Tax=Naumovozyma castellii TaxID=27288 RepID=G0VKV3_NAUCA|nr:hypothetical protein NCAS_0J01620 [Naumovozyma castellii CBS 4309]CCC72141.1 hypothetical protein NCAS_0J01620 [Naumovozyma castellii CBS 4309]